MKSVPLEATMMKRVGELNKEIELLKGQVNYWRIEAECDHGRWLRCLEDLEKLRALSFVTMDTENARLKAEVTDLKSKADGFKAEVDGYKHTGYSIGMLQGKLTQKCQDYLEAQKQNEANVQLVRNLKAEVERLNAFTTRTIIPNELLKAEVERLTNNCNYLDQKLDEELDNSAMLCGQVERLTKAGDAMVPFFPETGRIANAWHAAKHAAKGVQS